MADHLPFEENERDRDQQALDQTASSFSSSDSFEQEVKDIGTQFENDEAPTTPAQIIDEDPLDYPCDQLEASLRSLSTEDHEDAVDPVSAEPSLATLDFEIDETGGLNGRLDSGLSLPDPPSPSHFNEPSFSVDVLFPDEVSSLSSAGQSTYYGHIPESPPDYWHTGPSIPQQTHGDFLASLQQSRSMHRSRIGEQALRDSGYDTGSYRHPGGNAPADGSQVQYGCSYHQQWNTLANASQSQYDASREQPEIKSADAYHSQYDEPRYLRENESVDSTHSQFAGPYYHQGIATGDDTRSLYGGTHQEEEIAGPVPSRSQYNSLYHPMGSGPGVDYHDQFFIPGHQQGNAEAGDFHSQFGDPYPQPVNGPTDDYLWPYGFVSPGPSKTAEVDHSHGQYGITYRHQRNAQTDGSHSQRGALYPQQVNAQVDDLLSRYDMLYPQHRDVQADSADSQREFGARGMVLPKSGQPVSTTSSNPGPSTSRATAAGKHRRAAGSRKAAKEPQYPFGHVGDKLICKYPKCKIKINSFDTKHDLKQHQRNHIPEEEHENACVKCKKKFLYPKDLRRHEESGKHKEKVGRAHSPKQHKCKNCKKKYARKDGLERHRKMHCRKIQADTSQSGSSSEESARQSPIIPSQVPELSGGLQEAMSPECQCGLPLTTPSAQTNPMMALVCYRIPGSTLRHCPPPI